MIKHFFCSTCKNLVQGSCEVCKDSDINYFIEIPIIAQIAIMFKRKDFYKNLMHRFVRKKINQDNLEDIYDGSVYKQLFENSGFLSKPSNISFMWNSDGVPLFRSSKFSIWPLYLVINELPYSMRFRPENVLFAGLWFGLKKPEPHVFIGAFKPSFKRLYNGVELELANGTTLTVSAVILTGTCDLPAKALFLCLKQYNGNYGCTTCKTKGYHENHRHLYPYEKNMELRTTLGTISTARNLPVGESEEGVKGESPFSKIWSNYIDNMSIDVMHCVFLNVMKRLFFVWFDSSNHDHRGSLRKHISVINARLIALKPIHEVSRTPTTVEDYTYWKASLMKWFLLAYSLPIFHDIMDDEYFQHYKLLVNAINILTSTSIDLAGLNEAEECLDKFVREFEALYGSNNMTLNVHMLLHLVRNVRLFGPLWTTSCCALENLNGILKGFVKSSNHPELQIYSSLEMLIHYLYFKDDYLKEGSSTYDFCNFALKRTKLRKLRTKVSENLFIVGKYQLRETDAIPENVKEAVNGLIRNRHTIYTFNRLQRNGLLYETEEYSIKNKRNSSCVKYRLNEEEEIGIIQEFIMLCECHDGIHECCKVFAIVQRCVFVKVFKCRRRGLYVHNTYLIEKIKNISLLALDINGIETVCFSLKVDNLLFAVKPSYTIEFE